MPFLIKPPFSLLFVLLIISGCASNTEKADRSPDTQAFTACTDPRPQICTMQYDPVCAKLETGSKTYATDCTACSDPAVSGYYPGACE
jgi:hypothetical protein